MKAKEFDRLIFTPFHTSKILHHFLSGVQSINDDGIKTELVFLVLPIIYNEAFFLKLSTLNKSSKLFPFLSNNKDLQIFLSQINAKIKDYKQTTNEGLLLLSSKTEVSIKETIKCSALADYKTENNSELRNIYKAAFNFGLMLAKERYITIFLNLRITEI